MAHDVGKSIRPIAGVDAAARPAAIDEYLVQMAVTDSQLEVAAWRPADLALHANLFGRRQAVRAPLADHRARTNPIQVVQQVLGRHGIDPAMAAVLADHEIKTVRFV